MYFILKNSSDQDLTDWGQKLVLFMLKRGTPYTSLEEPDRSALHVALDVGIRTGKFTQICSLFEKQTTVINSLCLLGSVAY